jgi:hypothetical protein
VICVSARVVAPVVFNVPSNCVLPVTFRLSSTVKSPVEFAIFPWKSDAPSTTRLSLIVVVSPPFPSVVLPSTVKSP